MKPLMLFSIVAITSIILASSFGLHIMDITPPVLPDGIDMGAILYVCPAANVFFDSAAVALRPASLYITMAFFFATMMLVFFWMWALYQNLLKDKFDKKSYASPWAFTKILFWAGAVVLLLTWTPNHYRKITLVGAPGEWVLCESTDSGALPVRASAVKR